MKLICIDDRGPFEKGIPVPQVGVEYTPIAHLILNYKGKPEQYYVLRELGWNNVYIHSIFARTDGPDERDLIEGRHQDEAKRLDLDFEEICKAIPEKNIAGI